MGKIVMGRGAVNQKGPEATFLAALHAIKDAGRKLPVNLVLVAEGEEEIGSPHFGEIVNRADILAALKKTEGIFLPSASQDTTGGVSIELGAKGIVELELVSSGAKWGRGPRQDLHSSYKAAVDSPVWRLVAGAADTGDAGRQQAGGRRLVRAREAADRAAEGADRAVHPGAQREGGDGGDGHLPLDRRPAVREGDGAAGLAADDQHRRASSRATPARAARRSCRGAPWRRSTAAWCRT